MAATLDRTRHFGVIYGLPEPDEAVFEQDGKRFRADGTEAVPPAETASGSEEPPKRRGRFARAKEAPEDIAPSEVETASVIETEGLTFLSTEGDEHVADLL